MDKLQLFQNLVNMAAADGKFRDQEVEFLVNRAEKWGISNDDFESILVGVKTQGAEFEIPESPADRELLMKELIRIVAADGELAEIEKQILATVSARFGYSTPEFSAILDSVIDSR
ncbi:MAG: TerB family tellurite resistance protein [Pirellulaceae bacterium]